MKCAIIQPSYIPWRGYFNQIQKCDVFVFLDDVQFDKHGWRNRNRIKTANGTIWLTIPVASKGNTTQSRPIRDIDIIWDSPWNQKHWATIRQSYAKAPYFERYAPLLAEFYNRRPAKLVDLTIPFTIALAREMGLDRRFVCSSELRPVGEKTDRVLDILKKVGATHYISGPAARAYMEEDKLTSAGISLEYMNYDYSEYPQLYPPFDGQVSVLDTLFMLGEGVGGATW